MQEIDINNDWQLFRNDSEKAEHINLPFDAMINTKRNPKQQLYFLSAGFEGGKYTFIKKLPQLDLSKDYLLEFEGIYCNSKVYVNDQLAYEKVYGFTPFRFKLNQYLKQDSDNQIKVVVDFPKEGHNRWYTGAGIYRPVHLYVGDQNYFEPNSLKLTTLAIDPALIDLKVKVHGQGKVKFIVSELTGKEVTVTAEKNASNEVIDAKATLDHAKLWSAENPNLYQIKAVLLDPQTNNIIDNQQDDFGIRMIKVIPNKGLFVNNKHVFLRGGCIHNDNGVIGVINTDATELHRAKILKQSGFNAIRSAHHPMARSLMRACDKVGLYVLDEAFDSWYRLKGGNPYNTVFLDNYKTDVAEMVKDAYNHPCVIIYSIGNEIPEAGSLKGVRVGKNMVDIIHKYDKTRLTILCPSVHWLREYLEGVPYYDETEDDFIKKDPKKNKKIDWDNYVNILTGAKANIPRGQENDPYPEQFVQEDEKATNRLYGYLDLAGYNYYGDKYSQLHELHPERLIVGTETRGNFIVDRMKFARTHPYVIGNFIWTLQDHLGEVDCCEMHYGPKLERNYPWLINYGGVIDLIGNILPAVHRFEFAWNPDKHGIFLASQPPIHNGVKPTFNDYKFTDGVSGWSYPGCDGKKTWVDIYTDADNVKLFLNNKQIGASKVKDYHVSLPATYEPGKLEAIAYDKTNHELYRTQLVSASNHTIISAHPDKKVLKANGQDFVYIPINITDENRIIKRTPEHQVTLTIDGPAIMQGFGSSNPINGVPFNQPNQQTYLGQLLAVIRSTNEKGKIKITLSADGLPKKVIELTAK